MAATKTSTRSEIRKYQQELNAAGATPPLVIDGIWGPKTQAANDNFGASVDGTGETPSALKGTGPEGTKPRFGLAGGAQLWKNTTTGDSFIVYVVPGTESDPVYMRWIVPSEADVQSFFGPGQPVVYQNEYAGDDAIWTDTIDFGGSDDIRNVSKSPFDSWASTLAIESATKPWILDVDYQKLLAMSIIEKRPLTQAEIATTKWWKDNSPTKRQWMEDVNFDPVGAKQQITDGRLAQAQVIRDAGISGMDDNLINFISDKLTMGDWTQDEFTQQIRVLSDPYFKDQPMDPSLNKYMSDNNITLDTNNDREVEVRNLVTRWLGSNFGQWDDAMVSEWAGRIRNEPDAQEALVETLKDQRLALFPGYDREADYATISAPWKTMIRNAWGELPNDSDNMLQSIIRMNDAGEAGKYLTQEGLKRGNDTVTNSVQSELTSTFGGI